MEQEITDLTNYELVEAFSDETKRMHYDPCGTYEASQFSLYELRQELIRRLNR